MCQGNVATFNCSSSNVLGFIIDGIDAAIFIANQSESVTSIITISNGQYLGILSVPGNPKYDQLSIVCRAFGSQAVDSMTAVLHVLSKYMHVPHCVCMGLHILLVLTCFHTDVVLR